MNNKLINGIMQEVRDAPERIEPPTPTPERKDPVKHVIERFKRAGYLRSVHPANYDKLVLAFSDMLQTKKTGLILSGKAGAGKTFAIKALLKGTPIFEAFDNDKLTRLIKIKDIGATGSGNKVIIIDKAYITKGKDIILDDVGSESVLNDFGRKFNVVSEFIMAFHSAWVKDQAGRLFITTNLDIDGLVKAYGPRLFDRLAEMCDTVNMLGNSNRRKCKRY